LSTDPKQEQQAVTKVLRQFSSAYNTFDTDAFMATWDDTADRIVFMPEELRYAIFELHALRDYFDNLPAVIKGMHDVKVIDFELDVDGDAAVVFVRFWARLSFAKVPESVDGQLRQSFFLRKRADGWKIVHYHESRQPTGFERAVGDW
jgi:ketosteroid isomerase-like protein